MRLPGASLLSLLGLLAVAAHADARRTQGGTVRVVREKRAPGWQLFLAFNEGDRLLLYGDSRPPLGSTFAVVDTKGAHPEVRIEEVSAEPPSGCQGLVQARAGYATAPRRGFSDGVAVAFGPIERPLPHAQLVMKGQARGDLPHGTHTLLGAVDLDGNGAVDVAVYIYDCQRGPDEQLNHFGPTEVCIESFSREGQSWRQIRRTRLESCFK
jgi:hypothetical protein